MSNFMSFTVTLEFCCVLNWVYMHFKASLSVGLKQQCFFYILTTKVDYNVDFNFKKKLFFAIITLLAMYTV